MDILTISRLPNILKQSVFRYPNILCFHQYCVVFIQTLDILYQLHSIQPISVFVLVTITFSIKISRHTSISWLKCLPIHFKHVHVYLMGHSYESCSKVFDTNFNTWLILGLEPIVCLFHHELLRFSCFLVGRMILELYSRHFNNRRFWAPLKCSGEYCFCLYC